MDTALKGFQKFFKDRSRIEHWSQSRLPSKICTEDVHWRYTFRRVVGIGIQSFSRHQTTTVNIVPSLELPVGDGDRLYGLQSMVLTCHALSWPHRYSYHGLLFSMVVRIPIMDRVTFLMTVYSHIMYHFICFPSFSHTKVIPTQSRHILGPRQWTIFFDTPKFSLFTA